MARRQTAARFSMTARKIPLSRGDWVEVHSNVFNLRAAVVDWGVVVEVDGKTLTYKSNSDGKKKHTRVAFVVVVPSPEQIEAGCAEVRATWSDARHEWSRVTHNARAQIYGC